MDKLKFVLSGLWEFLAPFVKVLLSQAGRILVASALNAVKAMANRELDGEDKRRIAFQMITADLKSAGLELATSTINAAIEAAVVKLRN